MFINLSPSLKITLADSNPSYRTKCMNMPCTCMHVSRVYRIADTISKFSGMSFCMSNLWHLAVHDAQLNGIVGVNIKFNVK